MTTAYMQNFKAKTNKQKNHKSKQTKKTHKNTKLLEIFGQKSIITGN